MEDLPIHSPLQPENRDQQSFVNWIHHVFQRCKPWLLRSVEVNLCQVGSPQILRWFYAMKEEIYIYIYVQSSNFKMIFPEFGGKYYHVTICYLHFDTKLM